MYARREIGQPGYHVPTLVYMNKKERSQCISSTVPSLPALWAAYGVTALTIDGSCRNIDAGTYIISGAKRARNSSARGEARQCGPS